MHNPDNPIPDDYAPDIDDPSKQDVHTALLGLTYDFFRQASAQVLTEPSPFLSTQHGWHPIAGREAYIDRVSFSSPCTDKRTHSQQLRKDRSATERPYSSPQPGPRRKTRQSDCLVVRKSVRYRRTILAPARWVLPPTLTRTTHDRVTWPDVLTRWRAETVPAPPALVVVDDGDRCLPLDVDQAEDRELLRRYVGRGVTAVTEPPGGPDAIQAVLPGPTGRHLLELVVPLVRRETVPAPVRRAAVRARGTGLYLPGGRWLSLAIRTPACELLLPGLAALADDLAGHYDTWFWLRYHTPEHGPHLRARFRGEPATLGSRVLPALSAWCQEMIGQRLSGGFTVEPYDQEVERYGGPAAIGAAEDVFAADSSLALATLASVRDNDQRLVIAALSAAAIARLMTDASQAALDGRQVDRTTRRHLLDLRPHVRAARGQLTAGPDLGALRPAWSARHDALATYRQLLDPARRADCTSSLIHLHLNRLLGDMRSEPMVRALAADLLATPS